MMAMSRDKSVKLAQLYSRVDWLGKYSASLGMRLGEADAQVSFLEEQNRALELEPAWANGERDAQRALIEQKAQEPESHAAALRENMESLEARAAELQLKDAAIMALTDAFVQKDVLLEEQRSALEEREASMSSLLQ